MRAPDWSWTTPAGRVRMERRAEMIIRGGEITSERYVLEIGCGVGTLTWHLDNTTPYLTSIDKSEEFIEIARRRNPIAVIDGKRIPRLTFFIMSLEKWHPDPLVDVIVGSSTLHHLEIYRGLRKIYNLLKPGGHLSFAEPNLLNPQIWLERKFRRLFWYVSPSETAFTRWWIRDRLIEAGFIDVKVSPFDWLHPLTPRVLVPLVDRIGRLLERIPVIREFAGSLYIRARKPKEV